MKFADEIKSSVREIFAERSERHSKTVPSMIKL